MGEVKHGKADEGGAKSLKSEVVREMEGLRGGGDET